jgi:hypothetical protein
MLASGHPRAPTIIIAEWPQINGRKAQAGKKSGRS